MKKTEVESILLVDKYLISKVCEKDCHHISLTRRYLARKINKALQRRTRPVSALFFGLFTF